MAARAIAGAGFALLSGGPGRHEPRGAGGHDDFTFLPSWVFMSLASWALVMSRYRDPGNARAGYVYLVMASFGTLARLLAGGCRLHRSFHRRRRRS